MWGPLVISLSITPIFYYSEKPLILVIVVENHLSYLGAPILYRYGDDPWLPGTSGHQVRPWHHFELEGFTLKFPDISTIPHLGIYNDDIPIRIWKTSIFRLWNHVEISWGPMEKSHKMVKQNLKNQEKHVKIIATKYSPMTMIFPSSFPIEKNHDIPMFPCSFPHSNPNKKTKQQQTPMVPHSNPMK